MTIRIGINGFGRIGRSIFRLAHEKFKNIEIIAINDLIPLKNLAYLLTYDSVHQCFSKYVQIQEDSFMIEGKKIYVFHEKDLNKLNWKDLNIDYVVESTGFFTTLDEAKKHLTRGAKRVVISAPTKENIPTYVMGVNHKKYNPDTDKIISNASCTTHCLAPIIKVLIDYFGVEEGMMTTVHALTPSQSVHDTSVKKNLRLGRSGFMNIIPTSTGAAKSVGFCLPEVKDKLTGMAFRVPISNVSVLDLTVKLTKSTKYDKICSVIKKEANTNLKGILGYTEDYVVSSDFIGDTRSSIFDRYAGVILSERLFKIVSWYDNETGYSHRLLDLITYIALQE